MEEVMAGIAIGSILSIIAFTFILVAVTSYYESQAIEYNCAAYDSQTGEWDWIDKEEDE